MFETKSQWMITNFEADSRWVIAQVLHFRPKTF